MSQGNWIVDGAKEERCPVCQGTGLKFKVHPEDYEGDDALTTCDRCGGGGVIEK